MQTLSQGSMMKLNPKGPPPPPTEYNDPLDWTLIQRWRVADGDLSVIDESFGFDADGRPGLIWSLDGTVITLASNIDRIMSFSLSTAWDPDTATEIATRNVLNPGHMFANKAGTIIWVERQTDTFVEIPASNFAVTNSSEASSQSKAAAGFTGSSDISFYPVDDFSSVYIDGDTASGDRVKRIDYDPAGDLGNRTAIATGTMNWTQNGGTKGSKLSLDGTRIYRCLGSQGIEILEMSTPFDATTMTTLGTFNIVNEAGLRPDAIWTNPEDTTEVWVSADTGGLELSRMATNVA